MNPFYTNQLLSCMYEVTQQLLRRPQTLGELSHSTNINKSFLEAVTIELMKHKHITLKNKAYRHNGMTQYKIWQEEGISG